MKQNKKAITSCKETTQNSQIKKIFPAREISIIALFIINFSICQNIVLAGTYMKKKTVYVNGQGQQPTHGYDNQQEHSGGYTQPSGYGNNAVKPTGSYPTEPAKPTSGYPAKPTQATNNNPTKPTTNNYGNNPTKPTTNNYGNNPTKPTTNNYGNNPTKPTTNNYGNNPTKPTQATNSHVNPHTGYSNSDNCLECAKSIKNVAEKTKFLIELITQNAKPGDYKQSSAHVKNNYDVHLASQTNDLITQPRYEPKPKPKPTPKPTSKPKYEKKTINKPDYNDCNIKHEHNKITITYTHDLKKKYSSELPNDYARIKCLLENIAFKIEAKKITKENSTCPTTLYSTSDFRGKCRYVLKECFYGKYYAQTRSKVVKVKDLGSKKILFKFEIPDGNLKDEIYKISAAPLEEIHEHCGEIEKINWQYITTHNKGLEIKRKCKETTTPQKPTTRPYPQPPAKPYPQPTAQPQAIPSTSRPTH